MLQQLLTIWASTTYPQGPPTSTNPK